MRGSYNATSFCYLESLLRKSGHVSLFFNFGVSNPIHLSSQFPLLTGKTMPSQCNLLPKNSNSISPFGKKGKRVGGRHVRVYRQYQWRCLLLEDFSLITKRKKIFVVTCLGERRKDFFLRHKKNLLQIIYLWVNFHLNSFRICPGLRFLNLKQNDK